MIPAVLYPGASRTIVQAVNRARLSGAPCSGPVSRVHWSKTLESLARRHSQEMAQKGKINHDGFSRRLRAGGYRDGAENVAMGYHLSPYKVVRMWLNSPAHCRNLMKRRFNVMGMAKARRGRVDYWTLIMGRE